MLLRYLVYARVKRWAWDGLDRLHKVLMERGEPIPEPLQNHVNEAHHGLLKQPSNPNRNPRYAPQDDRDFRIMHVVRALCGQGRTREQAIAEVADAMGKERRHGRIGGKEDGRVLAGRSKEGNYTRRLVDRDDRSIAAQNPASIRWRQHMFGDDKFYFTDHTALLALAPYSTMAHWRSEGRGPAYVKIGSRVAYRGADLNAWLKSRRVEPRAA